MVVVCGWARRSKRSYSCVVEGGGRRIRRFTLGEGRQEGGGEAAFVEDGGEGSVGRGVSTVTDTKEGGEEVARRTDRILRSGLPLLCSC